MAGEFTVALSVENEERLDEILEMDEDFQRRAEGLHLDAVFQIHKFLIRLTPMDTGELRGGWLAVLKKYNQDYGKQVRDTSLSDEDKAKNKTPRSREYHFDSSKIEEGASLSFFEDEPFDTTIINAVQHGEYLEFGTSVMAGRHFVELARYKGEFWYNHIFEQWFEKIASEGKIVEPDDQSHNDIPN